MENKKELEKLVFDTSNEIWNLGGRYSHNTLDDMLRTALTLADKQGYMRGFEDGEKNFCCKFQTIDTASGCDYHLKLHQAHDAISKLK